MLPTFDIILHRLVTMILHDIVFDNMKLYVTASISQYIPQSHGPALKICQGPSMSEQAVISDYMLFGAMNTCLHRWDLILTTVV